MSIASYPSILAWLARDDIVSSRLTINIGAPVCWVLAVDNSIADTARHLIDASPLTMSKTAEIEFGPEIFDRLRHGACVAYAPHSVGFTDREIVSFVADFGASSPESAEATCIIVERAWNAFYANDNITYVECSEIDTREFEREPSLRGSLLLARVRDLEV